MKIITSKQKSDLSLNFAYGVIFALLFHRTLNLYTVCTFAPTNFMEEE